MIVSVPFTLPGLVHSINTNIHVGVGTRLFDIAFLLEVSVLHFHFSRREAALNPAGRAAVYPSIGHILHAFESFPRQRYNA
jgi:hypothetical protein